MSFEQDTSAAALDGLFLRRFHEAPRAAAHKSARGGRLAFILVLAGGCALGALFLTRGTERVSDPESASSAPLQTSFVADDRLAPLMAFEGLEADRARAHYVARIRSTTGERSDTLTFGDPDNGDLLFRVSLVSAAPASPRPSLFVTLAKQSAELGAAVIHAANPQSEETILGSTEWADIRLADRKGERSCLGFRAARSGPIDVSGFACGDVKAPVDRAALACLIDRLALTSAGQEAGLAALLKSDAVRKAACPRVVG
jgi:hypothetical protein